MKVARYIVSSLILLAYISIAVFGLFSLSSVHHHSTSSNDMCPFVVGEQSICMMSVVDYMHSWNAVVRISLLKMLNVVYSIALLSALVYFCLHAFVRKRFFYYPLRERFFAQLFSQGILNSKAY